VEPVMAQFDISNLPSGNYLLAVEIRDRAGTLITRRDQMIRRNHKVEFNYDLQAMDQLDLSNTFAGALMDRDTLAEHINSMRPIADPLERKIIDDRRKDRDLELMRRFFYSFWANRSTDPEAAWKDYREQVIIVNKLFGCRVQKGYENDRGLIYLKYGAPNSMMDRLNEMDSYPYTIWHYYQAGRYRDKRFVFYQPALGSDCFELLHSEVPGELNNPRWNQMLHSRNVPMQNVDPQNVNTISGDRAREFFDMPR
jgi:GWxTD domain-containing protein